jgi:hypothetical protein
MVVAALLGEGDRGYIGLAGTVPMVPPERLAILGYDDTDIDPRDGTCSARLSAIPTVPNWPPIPSVLPWPRASTSKPPLLRSWCTSMWMPSIRLTCRWRTIRTTAKG